MEAQLQELIQKIKDDGVKTAQEESQQILDKAKNEAEQIVSQARKEAEQLKAQAQNDALRFESSSKEALNQAARNLLIQLRQSVEEQLNAIVSQESGQALKGKSLVDSISVVMENWAKGEGTDLSLMVPEAELKAIEKDLKDKLSAKMKEGLELKPFSDLEAGFRISSKDGKMFYDFSDDELTRMISRYLNSSLQELLQS